MSTKEMENIILEVEHSLAVENLIMSNEEKDNLRRVWDGEITFSELISSYVTQAQAHAMAKAHA